MEHLFPNNNKYSDSFHNQKFRRWFQIIHGTFYNTYHIDFELKKKECRIPRWQFVKLRAQTHTKRQQWTTDGEMKANMANGGASAAQSQI